jgi:hypothetical protein
VDPIRNPYAPGAGQRPPELACRDREVEQFDIVLERIAKGRPERSLVLTGLRGVGKTVLLNTLRSQAIGRLWGTGKIEARLDQTLRRATPAEREYVRAMALLGDGPVSTADVALSLVRKPSSLSPARDSLIKKGLVYAAERGSVDFTVPHFGHFLRTQPV